MVSDITYILTDEGWLYLARVMDLCGEKIVGISMDSRMTKELCMNTLLDAISHTDNNKGMYSAFGQRQPVLFPYLSGAGKGTRVYQQHEPQRQLLGQCTNGELLGQAQAGMAQ